MDKVTLMDRVTLMDKVMLIRVMRTRGQGSHPWSGGESASLG